jgi:hypothetical protein
VESGFVCSSTISTWGIGDIGGTDLLLVDDSTGLTVVKTLSADPRTLLTPALSGARRRTNIRGGRRQRSTATLVATPSSSRASTR